MPRPLRHILMTLVAAGGALLAVSGTVRAQEAQSAFSISAPRSGDVIPGEELTFTVTKPEVGKDYVWSFGDGSLPVTGLTVKHTFTGIDDFTVTLAANDGGRQTRLGAQVVRVAPEFRGVFASDIDGQFTPADQVQMAVVVRGPGLTTIGVRTSGTLIADRSAQFDLTGGEDYLILPDMQLANERDPIVREDLLKKPGASIPLTDGAFTLALDYTTKSGKQVTLSSAPPVRDFFTPDRTLAMTYPKMYEAFGMPPEGPGGDNYYLVGDADFTHPNDYYVRLLALEFGRRGGPWPDDPGQVATNIYRQIDALLADGDPAEFNNDYNLARLFEDGTLSKTRKNAEYICIGQALFFNALARTLGFPAREINNAIGEPSWQGSDGLWRVRWWQEGGAEVYYNGAWHYFDPFAGVTDRQAYLAKNLIYQSWAAFDRQAIEFRTVNGQPTGLKGHDFNRWPGDPPIWSFLEQGVRPGIAVEGMLTFPDEPVTALPPAPVFQAPPAAGINALPLLARPTGYDLLLRGRGGLNP